MTELNLGGVPDWPTCHRDDCDGIRVDAYHSCLAHLPEEALTTVLNVLGGLVHEYHAVAA